MSRRFLIGVAAAAFLAAPAAVDAQSGAPATTSNAPTTSPQRTESKDANKTVMLKQGEWRGSKLTGLTVYNNNDERVGEINELIMGKDGRIESVVLGVGGFLGIGEHNVAVPFGQVKFVEEPRRTAARTDERTRNEAAGARNDAAARMDANRNVAANAPASNAPARDRAPETTGTTTRAASNDGYRGYPDHAVISMSKDQLKALPGLRYSR
jgi:sporulation protein YlmC with PRC-barrel domain